VLELVGQKSLKEAEGFLKRMVRMVRPGGGFKLGQIYILLGKFGLERRGLPIPPTIGCTGDTQHIYTKSRGIIVQ